MRLSVRLFTIGTLVAIGTMTAGAQRPARPARPLAVQPNATQLQRRQAMKDRLASLTPAQRKALKAQRQARRARIAAMTPAQREALKTQRQAFQAERQSIAQRMKSGALTKEQARTEMRTWRQSHRPTKPA